MYVSQTPTEPCAQPLGGQAKALLMSTPLPAGSGAEGRERNSACGSLRAAAADGDLVCNASGSIREGLASQVSLVSCVRAIANLFAGRMTMPTWFWHASAVTITAAPPLHLGDFTITLLQGGAAGDHPSDVNMAAAGQHMPPDKRQAAAGDSVALPPASGHSSSGRPALDEGELGLTGAQAAGDAQGAAEPSPAEQPLPDSKVQAGAPLEAESGWDQQGRGQPAKPKDSETVELETPGQLPAEGSTHQLQQQPARAALQAGCGSQQQAGTGAGGPLLGGEGSPSMAGPRLLQSQVQSLAGSATRSVDYTPAGAAGPPSAQCVGAEEAGPPMTIPDSEEQVAAGQGRAVPSVPQESAAGAPAVPSPTDGVLRPAVPACLPAVFGGSLAGKQAGAETRSVSTDPVASHAESIDTSTQVSALGQIQIHAMTI